MTIPTTCAKIVLITLNTIFIAAGAFLIYIGTTFKGGHWSDVFSSATATSVDTLGLYIMMFGCGVCAIAFFGFFGALCRSKALLTVYSVFVFIAMALFIVFAVLGFMSASTASKWNDNSFPAATEENDVAKGFNEVYCYAQGGRLCTTASAREAFISFIPTYAETIVSVSALLKINVDEKTGINGFCGQVDKQIAALGAAGALAAKQLPSQYKQVCETCATVDKQYGEYKAIFEWTEEKCPLSPKTATFCGQFLISKKQTDLYKDAPYESCRSEILGLWKSYSYKIAIGSTVLAVASLFLIYVACEAGKNFDYSNVY